MKYTIHYKETYPGDGVVRTGLEIQPPVDDRGIANIVDKLHGHRPVGHAEIFASLMRADTEGGAGTAFIAEQVHSPGGEPITNARAIAEMVGKLIDPAGVHQVAYEKHLDR